MYVLIMGCGRVGARLANMLADANHEVTILDVNSKAFWRLGPDFKGTTLIGNGIDVDVLRRAGIERSDAFVACTQGDNRNIMASQIARHIFKVPKVVTRVYDPIRQDTFAELGLDTISPTVLGAAAFMDAIVNDPAERG
jgi:trk system potassium uptake protein